MAVWQYSNRQGTLSSLFVILFTMDQSRADCLFWDLIIHPTDVVIHRKRGGRAHTGAHGLALRMPCGCYADARITYDILQE